MAGDRVRPTSSSDTDVGSESESGEIPKRSHADDQDEKIQDLTLAVKELKRRCDQSDCRISHLDRRMNVQEAATQNLRYEAGRQHRLENAHRCVIRGWWLPTEQRLATIEEREVTLTWVAQNIPHLPDVIYEASHTYKGRKSVAYASFVACICEHTREPCPQGIDLLRQFIAYWNRQGRPGIPVWNPVDNAKFAGTSIWIEPFTSPADREVQEVIYTCDSILRAGGTQLLLFPYDLRLVAEEPMVLEVQCVINEAASPRSIDIYVSPKYIREIEAKFYAEFGRRKEKTAMMKETRKAQGQAAEQAFLAEQAFSGTMMIEGSLENKTKCKIVKAAQFPYELKIYGMEDLPQQFVPRAIENATGTNEHGYRERSPPRIRSDPITLVPREHPIDEREHTLATPRERRRRGRRGGRRR